MLINEASRIVNLIVNNQQQILLSCVLCNFGKGVFFRHYELEIPKRAKGGFCCFIEMAQFSRFSRGVYGLRRG